MSEEEKDRAEWIEKVNASELTMSSALANEFEIIAHEEDLTVLDYLAVAKVMDAEGRISLRITMRNDAAWIDLLGLADYAHLHVAARLESELGLR